RTAALVREEAGPIEASFTECPAPEAMTAPLAAFDQALKGRGRNPGTPAGLTAGTRFSAALMHLGSPQGGRKAAFLAANNRLADLSAPGLSSPRGALTRSCGRSGLGKSSLVGVGSATA